MVLFPNFIFYAFLEPFSLLAPEPEPECAWCQPSHRVPLGGPARPGLHDTVGQGRAGQGLAGWTLRSGAVIAPKQSRAMQDLRSRGFNYRLGPSVSVPLSLPPALALGPRSRRTENWARALGHITAARSHGPRPTGTGHNLAASRLLAPLPLGVVGGAAVRGGRAGLLAGGR